VHQLEIYYTGARYPPLLDVSEEEAREVLKIAEIVRRGRFILLGDRTHVVDNFLKLISFQLNN